jgi:RNA polymerase sigma-70 factor (ECF subfamily)
MIEATARDAWHEVAAKVRPFVARRVPASSDVNDVMQEIFLRIQRGLHALRDEDRFGPWVYQTSSICFAAE